MTMSKKNYIRFAAIVKESANKEELVSKLMEYFREDNYRFDTYRFKKVSGLVEA